MRNISFMLTTRQVRDRTKDVTRRHGWENVKVGERLQGCEKCQGRRAGEPLVKIAVIEVVRVHRQVLGVLLATKPDGTPTDYVADEMKREGFPEMKPVEFVSMFCDSHKRCKPTTEITRIEFKYV